MDSTETSKQMTTKTKKMADLGSATQPSTVQTYMVLFVPIVLLSLFSSNLISTIKSGSEEKKCFQTCKIRIVESIPQNISFPNGFLPPSTYSAWKSIINGAQKDLVIAAYKSSLQGKHVLDDQDLHFAEEGDAIFSQLLAKGKNVDVRMVESFPPKDKGDNADGTILQQLGLLDRRSLDISQVMGHGKMHSKFLMADDRNFYMGSANLDWRSLNQKMELGFVVEDCSCLGSDLRNVYDSYWDLATGKKVEKQAKYNKERPMKINIDNEASEIYIASSPKPLNNLGRTWDLDALIEEMDKAKDFLYIHVMDYHPLFMYRKPRALWPVLDDAIRRAIARGVEIKILSAGIHYADISMRFLKALQDLNGISKNGSVEVKVFKVPPTLSTTSTVINRDRRTHNKVVVTESAAIVGTSNWSGDYFEGGTTGTAIVVRQTGSKRTMIRDLVSIFERNWDSEYAHPVEEYFEGCVLSRTATFCEKDKDPKLFATKNE